MKRGFSQTKLETLERIKIAERETALVREVTHKTQFKKGLPERIAEVEKLMKRNVIAAGRQGKIVGVDRQSGAAIIRFPRGGDQKFSLDALQFV